MTVRVAAKARIRRVGGRVIRRLGLLPGGESDRVGEDDALVDVALPQRVLVFFPDVPTNVYQLEQWYDALRALDRVHAVVVVTQDSRTTRLVRERSGLPVHCVARSATLDGLVARSDLALALYVSHHGANFLALRYPSMVHVYLGHGDSDKDISASNQLKAYDFAFVAGPAAVERIERAVPLYDAAARTVLIGRPQLDALPRGEARASGSAPRVLYAPTWEGAQPSVAYGSVSSHGAVLVRSLLGAGADVTYRPHPRTGANDARVRADDLALRNLVSGHPSGRVDTSASLHEAFAAADVLVTDVSSVAMEWLPTMKPLVVTVPARAGLDPVESPLLDVVPRLPAADAPRAAQIVLGVLGDDATREERGRLVEHYLGDVTPGASTQRFLDACSNMVALREREQQRLRSIGARA